MRVVFRRTGVRRYAIEALRDNFPDLKSVGAPGYDTDLPHDIVHFAVEAELGLQKALFGQLAAGGDGGFHEDHSSTAATRDVKRERRRTARRSQKLLADGHQEFELSEKAVTICWYEWLARSSQPTHRERAKAMAVSVEQTKQRCTATERAALSDTTLRRVCARLDELAAQWKGLVVGEGLTVHWPFPETR